MLRPSRRGTRVTAFENLLRARVFTRTADGIRLTPYGAEWFANLGVDAAAAARERRTLCRPCVDWSERRQHLAGALGSALLGRVCHLGWAKRETGSRVIRFTPRGQRAFLELVEDANRTSEALPMRERAAAGTP